MLERYTVPDGCNQEQCDKGEDATNADTDQGKTSCQDFGLFEIIGNACKDLGEWIGPCLSSPITFFSEVTIVYEPKMNEEKNWCQQMFQKKIAVDGSNILIKFPAEYVAG